MLDVVLDAGCTTDCAREHPVAWLPGMWETLAGRKVTHALGFSVQTQDSVEYMINVLIAAFAASALEHLGLRMLLYDDPALLNSEEYRLAAKIANAVAPCVFLSLHGRTATPTRRRRDQRALRGGLLRPHRRLQNHVYPPAGDRADLSRSYHE